MSRKHFFVNSCGCQVHHYGHDDRACSCREYFASDDEVTDAAFRSDHDIVRCKERGGACNIDPSTLLAVSKPSSVEAQRMIAMKNIKSRKIHVSRPIIYLDRMSLYAYTVLYEPYQEM